MKQLKSIHIDLDGVLVDFMATAMPNIANSPIMEDFPGTEEELLSIDGFAFEDIMTKHYIAQGKKKKSARWKAKKLFWKYNTGRDFWVNLGWMADGPELWEYCLALKQAGKIDELNVLTSPSNDPECPPGKIQWLKEKGIYRKLDNVYIEKDKWKFCRGPQDILIDATITKIQGWENAGGTPIHHGNTQDTIKELEKLGL